jgi:single-strand DNA-binding protein
MNKICLIGRLTKDPELKMINDNMAVATFSLAVDRKFKKDGQPTADFINIVVWSKTAEFVEKYFHKGQQVGITGRIQTRSWKNQEGKTQYATEVIAEEVFFADSKKDDGYQQNNTYSKPSQYDTQDSDDDIPF